MKASLSLHISSLLKLDSSTLFIVLISIFYLVVAYNSSGFIHADEHYQIIEFANYKLGLLSVSKLAWEFRACARSGLQPLICFVLFKLFGLLGVTDGYRLTFLLRAVTAIFSIFVITQFVNAHKNNIASSFRPWFIASSYLLWFLPYINVRFSSESWSGLFLLLSLIQIQKNIDLKFVKHNIILGVLLGLTFLFRYQSVLFIVGILLWFVLIKRIEIKNMLFVMAGLLIVLASGVMIDFWLYSKFTFSVYNYFFVNVIEGVASSFGTSPYYQYVIAILTAPGPFGIVLLFSYLLLWWYDPKNILLWVITPFLIGHSIIPHKELRFLFPLVNLCPLLVFQSLEKIKTLGFWTKLKPIYIKSACSILTILFLFLNIIGLFAVASTGAGLDRTPLTEYIYRNYDSNKTNIILNGDVHPYFDLDAPRNSYYNSFNLHIDNVYSIWQNDFLKHKKKGYKNILVIYNKDVTGPQSLVLMKDMGLTLVYQNISDLLAKVYEYYDPKLNNSRISIYEFK